MTAAPITAPCGQTITGPTPVAVGQGYSAHVSSCPSSLCKAVSGK